MSQQIDSHIKVCSHIGGKLLKNPNMDPEAAFKDRAYQDTQVAALSVFRDLTHVYREGSHQTGLAQKRRAQLILFGREVQKSSGFAELSAKAQLTFLTAFSTFEHGKNPLYTLINICRLLVYLITFWADRLPEHEKQQILATLHRAESCVQKAEQGQAEEDEVQEVCDEVFTAEENLRKRSRSKPLFPSRDISLLLTRLRTSIEKLSEATNDTPRSLSKRKKQRTLAYKALSQQLKNIDTTNPQKQRLSLVQSRIAAIPKTLTKSDISEAREPLSSFLNMTPIVKLRFTIAFLPQTASNRSHRRLACALIKHTLKAFDNAHEDTLAAVKRTILEACTKNIPDRFRQHIRHILD